MQETRPEDEIRPEELAEWGDVRDAFLEWVEMWRDGWDFPMDAPATSASGVIFTLWGLLDALEGNQDIMPSEFCGCVDLPQGSTYAEAVTRIRGLLSPPGVKTLRVEVDTESLEELEIVHCPICTAIDAFDVGDYEYQCQACGAIFVVLRGRQDIVEP